MCIIEEMKHTKLIFLLLPALLITGCQQNKKPTPKKTEFEVTYELSASLRKKDSQKTDKYSLTFSYKDSYFDTSAKVFSKDIAMISYGNALMSESESELRRFYSTLEFGDIESHYVTTQTTETASYMFAHRKVNNTELVAVTFKGFDYGPEWAGNFDLGATGNHHNFETKATEAYGYLKTYLAKYPDSKLWMTGYSRAGGIVNVLSHLILSQSEINTPKEKMFVYTFEAPKGLASENKIAYENVFNIVNSKDLITHIAPEEQYGLSRCGIDVDIYTEDFQDLVHAFDEDILVKDFQPDETNYQTEVDFFNYILNYLTKEASYDDGYVYIHTRSDFAIVQGAISQAADIIFTLSSAEIDKIIAAVKDMGYSDIYALLSTEGRFYEFITPFLDEDGYQYVPETLLAHCETIRKLAISEIMIILAIYQGENAVGINLMREVNMHYPEINYILLSNYEVPAEA